VKSYIWSFLKRIPASIPFALTISLLPVLALASEHEEVSYVFGIIPRDVWDLVLRIINFLILAGVLVYFTRKPIVNALRNSIESVRTLLKEAEASREASEARMKVAEDKVAGVDREASELLEAARQESEVEKERILSEAGQALEKLKAEASMAIEQELKKAQDILRREAAEAAVALAEKVIREKVTPEDQARFVSEYLEKLEAEH